MLQPGERLLYAPHAIERMAERDITEGDVRQTLEAPDSARAARSRPSAPPGIQYRRRIGSRTCKVYVEEGSRPMLVVTAVWHGEGSRGKGSTP